MKLKALLWYSLFFTVFFSSLSLVLSPQIPWAHKIGILLGLSLSFIYRFSPRRFNRWVFDASAFLALLGALIYGIWFAEDPVQSAIYFLGYLIVIRLFELESLRDYKFALLLSLFEISAGSLITVQLRYFLVFIAWLVSAFFHLSLITLSSPNLMPKILKSPSRLFSLLFSAGLFSILLGFFLFFFLPRIGFSVISLQFRTIRAWSGYSPEVRLGEVSELFENQTPVLRGRLLGDTGPREGLKWRMRALDYYENNIWQDRSGTQSNFFIYYNQPITVDATPPRGEKITQEIFLEPNLGTELPSAGWVYAYLLPYKFRSFTCRVNNYCALFYPSSERFHYLAYSVLPKYSEAEVRASLLLVSELRQKESSELASLLQLPKGSESICQLAQEIVGAETDPVKKLSLLQDFFKNKFKYSLTRLPEGSNPLEEFLFKSRRGNCEYFASAGVLLLRCLKVPSRLVVGFISGEWNPYQNYYLVRQSDAHTWVEIYLPGLGFMEFDPTPPGARVLRKTSSWFWRIIDPLVFRWNRWVVDYTIQDQIRGFRRIEAESYRFSYRIKFSGFHFTNWLRNKPWFILVIILLGGGLIFLSWRFSPQQMPSLVGKKNLTSAQKQALKIYLKMFQLMRKKGYRISPCLTGLELAQKFPEGSKLRRLVESITNFYYEVRFRGDAFPQGKMVWIKKAFGQLKKELNAWR